MFFKKKPKRYIFSPDELLRMKAYLEEKTARREVIELSDAQSQSFADWSAICEKMQSTSEKERAMLENLSTMFNKLANCGDLLSVWHKQLNVGIEHAKKMIEQGHP
jgi:hypothetical protein